MTGIEEVALIASLASAAVASYGAYQQGQQAKASANYNAQVDTQNAQIASEQATAQAKQDDRANYMRVSAAEAEYGASGTSGGSAIDVLGDMAGQGKLQEQQDTYQGGIRSRTQTNAATGATFGGSAAATAGLYGAGSSLIGGTGSALTNYQMLSRPGTPRSSGGLYPTMGASGGNAGYSYGQALA